MRPFGGPSEAEMVAEARRRRTSPVTGRFTFKLPAGADPADVARHLDGSVARARGGYATGQHHQPTADLIGLLEAIAAAAATPDPAVNVTSDQWAAVRVRKVLLASRDRAADSDVRNAVDAILTAWERFSRYDPRAETADAARPPRIAAAEGGWTPVGA